MQSTERVVTAIEFLARYPGSRLDDLVEALGIHKSNVSRLMRSLRDVDWVSSNDDHTRFSLGSRLVALGRAATGIGGVETAMQLARAIVAVTGEGVNVSVAGERAMMTVATAESTRPLRVSIPVGAADPFHSTAVGKVYLATLPRGEATSLLRGAPLEARTTRTLTSLDELEIELERVRAQGYATNIDEENEGVSAFAIPLDIVDAIGRRMIVSLTAPSSRLTPQSIPDQVRAVEQVLGDHRYIIPNL